MKKDYAVSMFHSKMIITSDTLLIQAQIVARNQLQLQLSADYEFAEYMFAEYAFVHLISLDC